MPVITKQKICEDNKRCFQPSDVSKLASVFLLSNLNMKEIKEPILQKPFIQKRPILPLVDIPVNPSHIDFELPSLTYQSENGIVNPCVQKEEVAASSLIKKRRKKMNKHKYKKRIHRDIAKIRKIRGFRLKKKRRRQAHKKAVLIKKLEKVLKKNPKSDLPNRTYVVYRLKNW